MVSTEDSQKELRAQALALLLSVRDQLASVHSLSIASMDAILRTQCDRATATLAGVEGQLSQALAAQTFQLSPTELMMLTRTVLASSAVSLAAQGQSAAANPAQALVTADAAATRATAERFRDDLFTRHIFDPYLQFSSPEDTDDYRAREAERQRYVAAQLARKAPEGDLNAAGAEEGQMLDAHAHGASRSLEFMPHWNRLVHDTEQQRAAMRATGQSTDEFDRNLLGSVRRFLKARHLSDVDIDARLAGGADPLEVVKPFLADDRDSQGLAKNVEKSGDVERSTPSLPLPPATASADATIPAPDLSGMIDKVAAKLKAAGLQMSDTDGAAPHHGVPVRKPTSPTAALGG